MAHHTATAATSLPRHHAVAETGIAQRQHHHQQHQQQHNSSIRHPVFFTEKLRRPPVTLAPGMGLSPVAHGYVYQDGRRRLAAEGNSAPKL
ncbi:uncharacterized protein CLUP02_15431 [Colletotrichum lupini]|uniref:Uncharacterized protein n=1 Tax=Colletotrichum lupini TaxID=145971 RepID=A0A9Q8WP86_9PEZI|nr:uncharacterized protein CLUP02_15431 [Colletotrichum lupini]UQC89900.1 hypothetical protein CLUP02_15431 [Colletotrichum lupini]